jgi:shikimate kinase
MKNIVLIGFMGSGKSKVARRLAEQLHVEAIETDDLITARAGMPINEIFKVHGEAYFRDLESAVIKEVAQRHGVIIDCGGGAVLRSQNLQELKSSGIVFYLQAAPEVIYERIRHEEHRPLLKSPDPLGCIKELYQQRLPLYNQADFIIDANGASIEGPVVEILKKV